MRRAACGLFALLLIAGCESWTMLSPWSSTDPQEVRMHELMKNSPKDEEPITSDSRIWFTDEPSHLDPQKITGGIQ